MPSKSFGPYLFPVAIFTVLLAACAGSPDSSAANTHWSYEGEEGPAHWDELDQAYALCASGSEQSPIDLANATQQDLEPISFHYHPSQVNILNNGHTIQVNYDPGSYLEVGGVRYELLQFHFHSPSEHSVEGASFPAELHLVHQAADGSLAVVGILLQSGDANAALQPVWDNLPGEETDIIHTEAMVDASDFLPADQAAYRYVGSLTTPPCSQGVSWFVLAEPVQMSQVQLQAFQAIYSGNNRPVQPLGDRELLLDTSK